MYGNFDDIDLDNPWDDGRPLQTSIHLFTTCDRYANVRLQVFGTYWPTLPSITVSKLLQFLDEADVPVYPDEHEELIDLDYAPNTLHDN